MEDLVTFFTLFLGYAPIFIASIVGMALAGVLWSTARKAAILMLVACVLQFIMTLANAGLYGWYLPHASHDAGYSSLSAMLRLWGVFSSLTHAVVFALLFWSAFTGRRQAPAAAH
jgi:hypothetical protein